jgi:hypothetical protein
MMLLQMQIYIASIIPHLTVYDIFFNKLNIEFTHYLTDHLAHIAMNPVKAPPIILCTALYIIFIGNNLLIPLMNLK